MKYPYMPIFWGDFLANTMDLSAQEAGAYLFLIAHAWEHGGEIPTQGVRLARIAHVRQDQWKRTWMTLEKFFELEALGPSISRTTHRRVTAELQRLAEISSKRSDAAKQKHSKSSAKGYANGLHPVHNHKAKDLKNGKAKQASEHAYRSSGMSPDQGPDYRSPPKRKSDNALQPIPKKGRFE